MRIFILLLYIFSYAALPSNAQKNGEPYQEMTANAIISNDKMTFTIKSAKEAYLSVSRAIIINNERAHRGLKSVRLTYDDFHSIEDASVVISNPTTNKTHEKYKLKDFQDVNLDFTNLTSDNREKILEPIINFFPYQIAVEYTIKYKYSLFYPGWYELPYENTRLEKKELIVIDETRNSLRFKCINMEKPVLSETADATIYRWKSQNKNPYKFEELSSKLSDYCGIVLLAPKNFEMEGYKGNMESWESFGNWIYQLNAGKNDLDFSTLINLDNSLENVNDTEEKIKIIYDYLQKNTRYISIQLGIGGWQPFSTSFVHEKKYGDCKALSFFTKSLLEHYGINSHYTLINAGRNSREIEADFPNPRFNHAILSVPLVSDTVFLECTSQTNPYSYMGTFTSDRNALIIKENESVLIRTKKYRAEDNSQMNLVQIDLDENGEALINTDLTFKGLEIENNRFLAIYREDSTNRWKWYNDQLKQTKKEILSFELKPLEEGFIPTGGYTSIIRVPGEAVRTGKRLFISPHNYLNNYLSKFPEVEERKSSIMVKFGYNQLDSITYNVPESFKLETGLSNVEIKTKYGRYNRSLKITENKLIYNRKFILNSGEYSPEEYNQFKDFFDSVISNDKQKIVLVKEK